MYKEKLSRHIFFRNLPWYFKIFTVFIYGDLIVLMPFVVLIALSYVISLKVGLILTGLYLAVRYFGEMIYWPLQQFSDRTYRPYDFGFTKLDNHAVYILYQTFAIVLSTSGAAIVLFTLLYVK